MYWTINDDMAVIKRHVTVPDILKTQALYQLHINHMGIKKSHIMTSQQDNGR